MSIKYWVLEFTNDRSQVFHDWERAKSATNAAKSKSKDGALFARHEDHETEGGEA